MSEGILKRGYICEDINETVDSTYSYPTYATGTNTYSVSDSAGPTLIDCGSDDVIPGDTGKTIEVKGSLIAAGGYSVFINTHNGSSSDNTFRISPDSTQFKAVYGGASYTVSGNYINSDFTFRIRIPKVPTSGDKVVYMKLNNNSEVTKTYTKVPSLNNGGTDTSGNVRGTKPWFAGGYTTYTGSYTSTIKVYYYKVGNTSDASLLNDDHLIHDFRPLVTTGSGTSPSKATKMADFKTTTTESTSGDTTTTVVNIKGSGNVNSGGSQPSSNPIGSVGGSVNKTTTKTKFVRKLLN